MVVRAMKGAWSNFPGQNNGEGDFYEVEGKIG